MWWLNPKSQCSWISQANDNRLRVMFCLLDCWFRLRSLEVTPMPRAGGLASSSCQQLRASAVRLTYMLPVKALCLQGSLRPLHLAYFHPYGGRNGKWSSNNICRPQSGLVAWANDSLHLLKAWTIMIDCRSVAFIMSPEANQHSTIFNWVNSICGPLLPFCQR